MTSNPFAYAGIGPRKTPLPALTAISAIARDMALKGWLLRSGGALGADTAFEEGCLKSQGAAEIFLPWPKFNGHMSDFDTPSQEAFRMAKEFHPNWDSLSLGGQKLMAVASHKLFGPNLADPVKMVICWTPGGRGEGGTGQAIRIAQEFDIPVIDLGCIFINEARELIHGRILDIAS